MNKKGEMIKMSEYLKLKGNEHLIGKKAKFKNNLEGYTRHLWNAKGTIRQLHQITKGDLDSVGLSLVFDKPLDIGNWTPMGSCYITPNSFELLKEGD